MKRDWTTIGLVRPVHGQKLGHLCPGHLPSKFSQPLRPEPVQIQQLPQLHPDPTAPELPAVRYLQTRQPDRHHVRVLRATPALVFVLGQQLHLPGFVPLVDHVDRVAPSMALTGSQLTEVKDRSLNRPALADTHALVQRLVDMLFAVLESLVRFQEHAGSIAQHANRNLRKSG